MTLWTIAAGLGLALCPLLSLAHTGPGPMIRVRDLWLLGLLAVAFAWTLEHAILFSPMAAWFLIRWRGVDVLPSLVTWVGIAATWELARALPVELVRLLPWAWVGIGCVLSAMIIAQRFWGKDQRTQGEPYGWLGQRTLASAWLALIIPFAPWWVLSILATGLYLTGPSWGAVIALLAGALVISPEWSIPVLACLGAIVGVLLLDTWLPGRPLWQMLLGGRGLLAFTPRGQTLDGLWTRLRKYRLILRHATFAGHGPNTISRQNIRWSAQYSTPEQREPIALGEAHCDYLGHCWDFGWGLGGLTILLAAWDIGSRLRWHDPWSAAAVVGAVIALGTFPVRVAPIGLTMLTIWSTVGR